MLRIECKLTGEIIESSVDKWRALLKRAKYYGLYWEDTIIKTKAAHFVNSIKSGYEDQFIKAYLI